MANDKRAPVAGSADKGDGDNRWLGSLRDALASANRAEKHEVELAAREPLRPGRAEPPLLPPILAGAERTMLLPRGAQPATRAAAQPKPDRTTLVRGKAKVTRTAFHQDPVVGWLVIVGGPGLGAYRPIFEGNNTIGRDASQRIALDYGDDSISSEEQAYLRYDSGERTFLFVPNLTKTNVVAVNDRKPTGAVVLAAMDVITMGRTQLAFVPFCSQDFDWAEISGLKE